MRPTIPTHLRLALPAALLAAAAALGGSAVGDPAIACAAPREWDIGTYDRCIAGVDVAWAEGKIATENLNDAYRECCEKSGGIWSSLGGGAGKCVAPPANAETQPTLPGVAPPPVGATQNPAPPPPPFRNPGVAPTVTLAPASPG
jgi:hypothetical protein